MKTLNPKLARLVAACLLGAALMAPVAASAAVTVNPGLKDVVGGTNVNVNVLERPTRRVAAPPCSAEKTAEVLAPVTASAPSVRIDCSLTLRSSDVVTKRLYFEGASASGVTVECNGATIKDPDPDKGLYMVEIYSKKYQDSATGGLWARPENVTLRKCNIIGAVSVYGESGTGVEPTRLPDYVTRARNNAPRSIVFDHVTITGLGTRIPLYLNSGVSYFQMLDSEIKGSTNSVNIYLDAETYRNTFRNNIIHATTSAERELMALDGSSYNIIINNRFSALNHGGIYLYRNCGEARMIRHSTPSGNTIINNVFYYNRYTGPCPAIMVGSRNGNGDRDSCSIGDRPYCNDDNGYPYGSSVSNYDYAQFNVVMQNQIYKRSVSEMIRVGRPDINTPNYIDHNEEKVEAEIERGAGCYISNGYPNFILDGQFTNLFRNSNGEPVCLGYRYTCNDGALSRSSDSTCQVSQVSQVDFECQATGNNNGCQKTAFCPAGKKIIGAKAACNLEFGTVSSTDLNGVSANFVKVLRASDNASEGSCTLGSTSIHSGQAAVSGLNRASFGCRERDSNGGDCHIKGTLYCR